MCKKMQRHLENTGRQLSGAPALEVTRVPEQRALRFRLVVAPDGGGAGRPTPGGTGAEACTVIQSFPPKGLVMRSWWH